MGMSTYSMTDHAVRRCPRGSAPCARRRDDALPAVLPAMAYGIHTMDSMSALSRAYRPVRPPPHAAEGGFALGGEGTGVGERGEKPASRECLDNLFSIDGTMH